MSPFTADEARAQLEAMVARPQCRDCGMVDPPTTEGTNIFREVVTVHDGCPKRELDMLHPLDETSIPLLRVEDLKRAMETIIALTEALDAAMAARARDARHLREWIEAHAPPPETSPPADP